MELYDLMRVLHAGCERVLGGLASPWSTRPNDALDLACTLSWDLDVFPYAWLWQELGATAGPPWFGRAYTIAIEPATSFPASPAVSASP